MEIVLIVNFEYQRFTGHEYINICRAEVLRVDKQQLTTQSIRDKIFLLTGQHVTLLTIEHIK